MVCEPTDFSLTENLFFDSSQNTWNKIEKHKRRVKDFNKLLGEIDTSCYSIDLNLDLVERRRKFLSHNLERAALYYSNRYKQVAQLLLYPSKSDSDDFTNEYTSFQKKLIRNILWPKKVKF